MSCCLQFVLECSATKTCTTREIQFQTLPCVATQVMEAVESRLSVPVCVQTLSYNSVVLRGSENLQDYRVRSGDTFHVSYLSEGDCADVKEVVAWLRQVVEELEKCTQEPPLGVAIPLSPIVENLSFLAIHTDAAFSERLSVTLFYPWGELDRKYINKVHFLHLGGHELLCRLFALILTVKQWNELPYWLQRMEGMCGLAIVNFTETFELRRRVLEHNCLELCFKSLLRHSLSPESGPLCYSHIILINTMRVALIAVSNLSEVPECHMPIALRTDVLTQAIHMSRYPIYTCSTSTVAVSIFICIAQSYDTHQHIATPSILEGLLACCTYRETHACDGEEIAVLALKCYTGVVLAQLIIPSLHLIPTDLHASIEKLMSETLSALSPSSLKEHDENEKMFWYTLLPYVKLLYLRPGNRLRDCEMTPTARSIVALSADMILLCLHGALLREVHQRLLVREKLVDYVVCLPWIVPSMSQQRARELVADIKATSIGLQPPPLITLAKAALSKQCQRGLEDVLSLSSARDIAAKFSSFTLPS